MLNIPKGDQRPYSTRDGRYYVRSGARCRRASREELLRLFQAAHSLFYDEQPLPRLTLLDLDLDAVTRYLIDTNQVDLDDDLVRLLRAWRMYDGSSPTVGGLVLFGRNPQARLESSRVVVGALAGDDIGDNFVDRKDLSGPLLSVIAQIETFLRLHLRTGHEIVGFEKEKREEIPLAALREAVVNALVHRDYTIAGPTRVFVLSDRCRGKVSRASAQQRGRRGDAGRRARYPQSTHLQQGRGGRTCHPRRYWNTTDRSTAPSGEWH